MLDRLSKNWVYGSFPAGIMLLILLPIFASGWPLVLTVAFLQLPVYMLHQFEEHDDDRFRRYFNAILGDGYEVLSPTAVWIVNVLGVWGVYVVSLFLAWAVDPGFGLIGIYLPLVNAIMHIRQAVRSRSYNPGLVTAVVLFLPASAFGIWAIQRAHHGTFTYHLVGLGVTVLIHAALMVYVRARRARLSRTLASANS